ncbi:ATP-dependent DNA helicase [Ramlibacter sp. H39-3-26]|uniref:ATP-dependent DNA helicase n=1 Tax=Curvibacter soli TaxID=3031331 RepID=UPI0023DA5A95|nr:ATP-dependent DNA helicase [Ramlibacter sp. H39-3-26]MDF1485458.1 ATP-dependent DNA helicase [Ramlibacter sp. H39-3-26]
MTLEAAVCAAFAADGPLARADVHFMPRQGQTDMAQAVARTIEQGGALVVEAGTGVGKTFAYLVPALLSGERVLLSTATKALQDQLFARDLPQLVQVLGMPVRTALLKGRGSYLCLHRMEAARQAMGVPETAVLRALARIEEWSRTTRTGDLAELPGLDERSPVIPWVTSTRENCVGSQCPRFRQCHVNLARREALAADVVVINHHLFFADLAVRESGMAELLPSVRVVVFDEAHQINETGVQFLGAQLTTGQLLDFARDLLGAGLQLARGLAPWNALAAECDRAARDLRLAVGRASNGAKLRWTGAVPDDVDADAWHTALQALQESLEHVQVALDTVSELAPDFVRLRERARELLAKLARFAGPCATDAVRWLDVGNPQLRIVESPLDIAQAMHERLLRLPSDSAASSTDAGSAEGDGKSWIFTSATLGGDAQLRWFTEPCGLTQAQILRVESPFDYARQASLYIPRGLPLPSDPGHSQALARWIAVAVRRLGGRTLVLTTTLKALRTMGDYLQDAFREGGVDVLLQGQWPKRRLMERFREGATQGRPGCVLVASASFWEGFDVPGKVLQLVVIDKLPFPPPGDPLVEARSQRLEQAGRSAFRDYALPEAAVALKQGAGRLIRRETDSGMLVIGDTRLLTMGYGQRLLSALPPMRRIQTEEESDAALDMLTRASTTDPNWP